MENAKNKSDVGEGKMLTKEEFEKAISGSLLNREPVELKLIKNTKYSREVWNNFIKQIEKSKIPIKTEVKENSKAWGRSKGKLMIALLNEQHSQNLQAIALLTLDKNTPPLLSVYEIITMTPMMVQDYIKIMVNCLDKIAIEFKAKLLLPRKYRNIANNLPGQ